MTNHAPHLDAAHALRRPIPAPARPRAKPTKTWRRLKPGQLLANRESIIRGSVLCPAGIRWLVHSVNSLGAQLRMEDSNLFMIWSNEDWPRYFDRARRRKVKKS